jgi:hypothetical protein
MRWFLVQVEFAHHVFELNEDGVGMDFVEDDFSAEKKLKS